MVEYGACLARGRLVLPPLCHASQRIRDHRLSLAVPRDYGRRPPSEVPLLPTRPAARAFREHGGRGLVPRPHNPLAPASAGSGELLCHARVGGNLVGKVEAGQVCVWLQLYGLDERNYFFSPNL